MITSAPTHSSGETLRITYQKRPGLLKITLMNLLFNFLTLSIYRFWGKTNVRKHIWSSIHINGEPLEYTGTGMELFKGFLVVFFVFLLPFILLNAGLQIAYGPESLVPQLITFPFIILFWIIIGYALYKARKYQLTRTSWRGIRGDLVGSAWAYSWLYFGALIAKSLTFGWAAPAVNTALQDKITNDMRFGNAAFKFKGTSGPLYPTFAFCWILGVVLVFSLFGGLIAYASFFSELADQATTVSAGRFIGLIAMAVFFYFITFAVIIPVLWATYMAKQMRVFADYTRFDGAQFKLDITTWGLIWLAISSALMIIFTLGIAWPLVIQRGFKFFVDRLDLEGQVDIDRIMQASSAIPTRGEGLADAFDIGAF